MARTVAFKQHRTEPDWLVAGKIALAVATANPGQWVLASDLGATSQDPRTARRFARIAEFLKKSYPAYFDGTEPLRAGSAALLEFMKLREYAPEMAKELEERCFAGLATVAELKAAVEKARCKLSPSDLGGRRDASRRTIAFENLVLRTIKEKPILPNATDIDRIESITGREPLQPDLLVHYKNSAKVLALEIKAPRDSAARSTATVASELISRMAALRLRYEHAVLVLPEASTSIANETCTMWQQWVSGSNEKQATLDILLIGDKDTKWLRQD